MPDTAPERPERSDACCISLGAILVALGAVVILGWLLKAPVLVRLAPSFAPMVFNTALGFVLLGGVLAIPVRVAWRGRAQALAGATVALLAALVLTQDIFSVDLGVDYLFDSTWLDDPRPPSTRMAPTTAFAFLLAGAILALSQAASRRWLLYAAELATYVIGLVGVLGVCAYVFHIDFLLGGSWYMRMALHAALGVVLLAAGLWFNLRRSRPFREHVAVSDDLRILHTGATILVVTAIISGVVSLVAFERQLDATLKRGLELLLANRVDSFRAVLEQGAQDTNAVVGRSNVRHELARLRAAPDHAEALSYLDRAVQDLLPLGFSAAAFYDRRERRLAQAGRFAPVALRLPLDYPAGAELRWFDGLVLHMHLSVIEGGQTTGMIVAERRLTQIDRLFEDIRGLGETGEMAICGPRGRDGMVCLPTRLKPEAFVLERRMFGQLLPMSRALDGAAGVVAALDYRGQRVIAAHAPIPRTGLGMVVKMDADELYRPVLHQLRYGLPLVAGLVAGGLVLLWHRVRPLAQRLVRSQEEIRQLSLTDELTGLRNRRGFVTLAEAELALAWRMQRALLLFYADLDGLKNINDTWGHAEGDRAIRDVAAVLRRTFRDADILARLGGDEFAMLAFGNGEGNPETIVGRLQANMDELNETAGRSYRLALSIGVVRCDPTLHLPLDELLARADAEMYRVKQSRRATRRN
jgi:diguanylate cyclase (GGDEF)-like protein